MINRGPYLWTSAEDAYRLQVAHNDLVIVNHAAWPVMLRHPQNHYTMLGIDLLKRYRSGTLEEVALQPVAELEVADQQVLILRPLE